MSITQFQNYLIDTLSANHQPPETVVNTPVCDVTGNRFRAPLKFGYADGYLLVGGSLYCRSIDGIVSHTKICRNRIEDSPKKVRKLLSVANHMPYLLR